MQTTTQPTCAERIADALAREAEAPKEIYSVIDGNYDEQSEESETQQMDNAYEELYEYALGMNTIKETTITLSWGGPASYLEILHDGAEITQVTYRFSDWFDTATKEITDEESPLYRDRKSVV